MAVASRSVGRVKTGAAVKNYYILPCLLLLLNLVNNAISYKAELIADRLLRTGAVIAFVLFGGTITAFLVAPLLEKLVRGLHRSSKQGAGGMGEVVFLIALGLGVFWLYYQVTAHGIASVLPSSWRNPALK